MIRLYQLNCFVLFFAITLLCSCAVVIGNIKPIEEISNLYNKDAIKNSLNADWNNITPIEINHVSPEFSDLAFQNKNTNAILSISSSCRPSYIQRPPSLSSITRELLFGFQNNDTFNSQVSTHKNITQESQTFIFSTQHSEKVKIEGLLTYAISGHFEGAFQENNSNHSNISIGILVFIFKNCVFDIMLVSKPEFFSSHLNDFNRFTQAIQFVK